MSGVSLTLDPRMAEILRLIAAQDLPPYESMSGAQARAAAEERNRFWNEGNPEVGRVREATFPGPAGAMRLRLYEPEGVAPVSPAILYLHGGGWVICSLDTHDGVCRRLANAARVKVASLDYRMAPEHPYPAPLEDCVAAARGLRSHGRELGIDPDRVALAGDSAGANLALAALLALRDAGQTLSRAAALIYGVFSADLESPAHQRFGGGDIEWRQSGEIAEQRRGERVGAPGRVRHVLIPEPAHGGSGEDILAAAKALMRGRLEIGRKHAVD